MKRRAFTIIEVLVAIAIVVVLLAIVVPTVSHLRRRASNVKCAATLHVISHAFEMYSSMNGGYWPMVQDVFDSDTPPRGTRTMLWWDCLSPMLGHSVNADGLSAVDSQSALEQNDSPLFGCPIARANRLSSYGMNPYPAGRLSASSPFAELAAWRGVVGGPGQYCRAGLWKPASARALVADSTVPELIAVGWPWWLTFDGQESRTDMPDRGNVSLFSADYTRHGSRLSKMADCPSINLLFADGHVALTTPHDVAFAILK